MLCRPCKLSHARSKVLKMDITSPVFTNGNYSVIPLRLWMCSYFLFELIASLLIFAVLQLLQIKEEIIDDDVPTEATSCKLVCYYSCHQFTISLIWINCVLVLQVILNSTQLKMRLWNNCLQGQLVVCFLLFFLLFKLWVF